MISLKINDCNVDIVPIVKGLIADKDKVAEAMKKDYEAAAVALGIEDVESTRRRKELGEYDPSDLDSVYSYLLKDYGPIDMPDPSFTYLIDTCTEKGIPIIPLDMDDEDFSKLYCETVTTVEFLKEKRIMKKAMKKKFDKSSPEAFVMQWDDLMNEIKGYMKMSAYREKYMAEQIRDTAKYRKNLIAVIELERVDGIVKILEKNE